MAGYENIKNKGFDHRTTEELRIITSNGGKASGKARRRKAAFRETLNFMLTLEIDDDKWAPLLRSLGLDCTLETALNMAMIKEGLSGNVKAYEAVAKYSGQCDKPDEEMRNLQADTELKQARKQSTTGENESEEALHKLDEILKGVYENAVKQETE